MSPSITNSDILLPPRNELFSFGEGGAVEMATLMKLDWLLNLEIFGDGGGGCDEVSREIKERRPATSEIRCCEERLRGLPYDDEREELGC